MKNAFEIFAIIAAAAIMAVGSYKPSVPALQSPERKAISNVGMTPDQPEAAAAGNATEEIASLEPAATAPPHDALNPEAVVSLPQETQQAAPVVTEAAASGLVDSGLLTHGVTSLGSDSENSGFTKGTTNADSIVEQMRTASNRFSGFNRQASAALTAAAQDHANFMAGYRCYLAPGPNGIPTYNSPAFSHDTNGGSAYRVQKHGWRGGSQEILAMRPAGWQADCWQLWRGSPSHWQAVMSNTTHCGFGVATNPNDGCTYYVGLYGNESSAPAPAATAIPTARPVSFVQNCPSGFCGQAFVPQQPQQPRPRQYVQQPQQWQYQRPGLFGWRTR